MRRRDTPVLCPNHPVKARRVTNIVSNIVMDPGSPINWYPCYHWRGRTYEHVNPELSSPNT